MAKLKLNGKGKKAFKRLKTMNKELVEINKKLGIASTNLEEIIKNDKNIKAEFRAESKFISKWKQRGPDIPWAFENSNDAKIWFKYYDKLRNLIDDFVQPHYWDSIDYMRLRF